MRIVAKISGMALLVSLALMFFGESRARADEAPVEMATLAVKSLDSLAAMAKEAGIPLPPFLTAAGIERQFQFIGKDGLAGDRPIGIIFFGLRGTSPQKLVTFVLPVKAGAASIDSLKALGGQPMAGHDDTVVLNGDIGFRRTADYLVFSPSAVAAVAVKTQAFSDHTKAPDALGRLIVNVAAMREGMPEDLTAFLDNLEKQNASDNAKNAGKLGYAEGQKIATDWFKDSAKNLNRFEIGLAASDRAMRISAMVAPAKAPVIDRSDRPGMPATVAGRADLAISFGKIYPAAIPVIESWFNKGAIEQDAKGKPMTENQKEQMRSVGKRLIALLANPASATIGVELASGKPVIHIVEHWSEKYDGVGEIRELATAITKMEEKDDTTQLKVQTYDAGGETVLRVTVIEKGKFIGCLDVAQRGQNVFYSISTDDAHHIEKLLAAPAEGSRKDIISAEMDLGKTLDALAAIPDSDLAQIPPATRKDLTEMLRGRKATLSFTNHGDVTTVELTVDRALLKIIEKMAPKQPE